MRGHKQRLEADKYVHQDDGSPALDANTIEDVIGVSNAPAVDGASPRRRRPGSPAVVKQTLPKSGIVPWAVPRAVPWAQRRETKWLVMTVGLIFAFSTTVSMYMVRYRATTYHEFLRKLRLAEKPTSRSHRW